MLYYLVRPLARLALKFWFTKIHLVHPDRVPQSDPVIMAINHPTIFIEPCLMACYQPRSLYFLAKGVLFVTPFVNFLKSLHLIPLFRQKDGGFEKRKSNIDTFDYCYRKLAKNGSILIMPEGSSEQIRHLRTFNQGFAKMAFGAYEKDNQTKLKILPVGVNYSDADKFRSQVSLGFGEPLNIQDYAQLYEASPREAIKKLKEDLYFRMEGQVVHIKNTEDFLVGDQLLKLKENQNRLTLIPVLVKESKKITTDKKIIENFERLPKATKKLLKTQTQVYFSKLDKLGISDYALLHEQSYQLPTLLLLIVLHPIFLIGWMTHSIPYGFGLFCGSKTKDVETRMSVVLGLTFGFYLLYYPFLMILGWIYGGWPIFLLVSMLPIFGYFSILYFDQARRYQAAMKVRQTAAETLADLRKIRAEILSSIK